MKQDEQYSYDRGRDDFNFGISVNPYYRNNANYKCWEEGWEAAEADWVKNHAKWIRDRTMNFKKIEKIA